MAHIRSHLLLQIVYPNGDLFQLPAGGPLEMELEEEIAKRLVAKSVGLLRTTAKVEEAFREAFQEAMFEFKGKVRKS